MDRNMNDNLYHVLYEIEMYLEAPSPNIEYRTTVNNVFWECRLIHLRNLIDFFSGASKDDDIKLSDIKIPMKEDNNLLCSRNHPAYKAINKAVCHLTKSRYSRSKNCPNLNDYFDEAGNIRHDSIDTFYKELIMPKIEEFLEKVLKDPKYSHHHERVNKLKDIIKKPHELFNYNGVTSTAAPDTVSIVELHNPESH